MKEILRDLQISLEELLDILNANCDIMISDSEVLDSLDDETINEVYTVIQSAEWGQTFAVMIGEQY